MKTLDWRDLAPEPDIHECDCSHCDMGGDLEPIKWPTLVVARDGDAVYVTDRYLLVEAAVAPVPDGYEGPVFDKGTDAASLVACLDAVTDEPATGLSFQWSTLKAVETMGWRLRHIAGSDKRVAVVADGRPIGVTIAQTERDGLWGPSARPYVEAS